MSKSTAVAVPEAAALPSLAPLSTSGTLDIGTDDVSLPRLYMGQPGGDAAQESRVPAHCLWLGLSADDPDPNVLYTEGNGEGVLAHVLSMTKGMSASIDSNGNVVKTGGDLRSYNRNQAGVFVDRNGEPAPDGAYFTFNYVLCLPEVEPDVPVKLMLKSSSAKTAKRINFLLMKNAQQGPAHALAFRLTTVPKKQDTYRWTEMVAKQADADPANVQIADAMLRMLDSSDLNTGPAASADLDEPSI